MRELKNAFDCHFRLQNLLDLGHDIPSEGSKLGVSNIVNLISDLDSNGLQYLESILFSKKENVPFLLQPLVETPSLVQVFPRKYSLFAPQKDEASSDISDLTFEEARSVKSYWSLCFKLYSSKKFWMYFLTIYHVPKLVALLAFSSM